MRIAERVCALAEEQNNPALKIGAYHILAATFYHLGDFQAARKYARSGIQIWRSGAVQSPVEDFETAAVCCLCYDGVLDWHFGEMDSCQARMAEAIALAKELNDMPGWPSRYTLQRYSVTVSVIQLTWNVSHQI